MRKKEKEKKNLKKKKKTETKDIKLRQSLFSPSKPLSHFYNSNSRSPITSSRRGATIATHTHTSSLPPLETSPPSLSPPSLSPPISPKSNPGSYLSKSTPVDQPIEPVTTTNVTSPLSKPSSNKRLKSRTTLSPSASSPSPLNLQQSESGAPSPTSSSSSLTTSSYSVTSDLSSLQLVDRISSTLMRNDSFLITLAKEIRKNNSDSTNETVNRVKKRELSRNKEKRRASLKKPKESAHPKLNTQESSQQTPITTSSTPTVMPSSSTSVNELKSDKDNLSSPHVELSLSTDVEERQVESNIPNLSEDYQDKLDLNNPYKIRKRQNKKNSKYQIGVGSKNGEENRELEEIEEELDEESSEEEEEYYDDEDDDDDVDEEEEERRAIEEEMERKAERERNVFVGVPEENIEIKGLINGTKLYTLKTPTGIVEREETLLNMACGFSTSTYPISSVTNKRDGDPICDQYEYNLYDNRVVVALADGCNWGKGPREAAYRGVTSFCHYLHNNLSQVKSLTDCSHFLLRAFSEAHHNIINAKEISPPFLSPSYSWSSTVGGHASPTSSTSPRNSIITSLANLTSTSSLSSPSLLGQTTKSKTNTPTFNIGTTTLVGGISLQLRELGRWCFVCCSVGDCKVYHFSLRTGRVTDITSGNRGNISDPTDPGGRLGPFLPDLSPDLRNLRLSSVFCEEGDFLILCTDGVHDNFDPEQLGFHPSSLGFPGVESWDRISDDQAQHVKTRYAEKKIASVFKKIGPDITPRAIVRGIIDFVFHITKPSREFMHTNPFKKLPKDQKMYPGKMDHSTLICFKVGMGSREGIFSDVSVEKKLKRLQELEMECVQMRSEFLCESMKFRQVVSPLTVTIGETECEVFLLVQTISKGNLLISANETSVFLQVTRNIQPFYQQFYQSLSPLPPSSAFANLNQPSKSNQSNRLSINSVPNSSPTSSFYSTSHSPSLEAIGNSGSQLTTTSSPNTSAISSSPPRPFFSIFGSDELLQPIERTVPVPSPIVPTSRQIKHHSEFAITEIRFQKSHITPECSSVTLT